MRVYTSRVAGVATYDAAGSTAPRRSLGKDEFLQILVTQLRNLDIGEGASNQEFIAQMAQFTMVEELQNLSATVTEMMSRQMIAEAGGLVGKTIEAWPPGYTTPITGRVSAVEVIAGLPFLRVGDVRVSMNHVTKIS
jgi:flagellar basal-body rod modification protein FlgD